MKRRVVQVAVTYDSTVLSGNDNLKFWIGDANGLSPVKSAELAGAGAWDGLGAIANAMFQLETGMAPVRANI